MKLSLNDLLAAIREMSPSELEELSAALQETFSVTVGKPQKPKHYDFWQYYRPGGRDVVLHEAGPNTVQVIKEVRYIRGIGLKEAKELVEHQLPMKIKKGCEKEDAYAIKDRLEACGAVVSLEPGYVFDPLPDGLSYD